MSDKSADKKVEALMKKVQKRKEQLGEVGRPQWSTNCRLQLPGYAQALNIQVESNTSNLAAAFGVLKRMQEDFEAMNEQFGLEIPAKFGSYQLKEWRDDIQLRIRMLQREATERWLNAAEKKLDGLMSPEQKRQRELESLEESLGEI